MPKCIDVHRGFAGITQDQPSAAHQRDPGIRAVCEVPVGVPPR